MTCTPGFFPVSALLLTLDGGGVLLWGTLACLLHELGHWAAVTALGGRVARLRLSAVGAEMVLDPTRPLNLQRELLCALAGPAVSLVFALGCARGGAVLPAGISLSLGLFNLLPVSALDGGRALGCALSLRSAAAARRVGGVLDAVTAGGILGAGAAACLSWGNPTLFITGAWLAAGAIRSA